ncbi:hypothetical protein ACFL43_00945 [Thermodesulfobacteriota bacterium]
MISLKRILSTVYIITLCMTIPAYKTRGEDLHNPRMSNQRETSDNVNILRQNKQGESFSESRNSSQQKQAEENWFEWLNQLKEIQNEWISTSNDGDKKINNGAVLQDFEDLRRRTDSMLVSIDEMKKNRKRHLYKYEQRFPKFVLTSDLYIDALENTIKQEQYIYKKMVRKSADPSYFPEEEFLMDMEKYYAYREEYSRLAEIMTAEFRKIQNNESSNSAIKYTQEELQNLTYLESYFLMMGSSAEEAEQSAGVILDEAIEEASISGLRGAKNLGDLYIQDKKFLDKRLKAGLRKGDILQHWNRDYVFILVEEKLMNTIRLILFERLVSEQNMSDDEVMKKLKSIVVLYGDPEKPHENFEGVDRYIYPEFVGRFEDWRDKVTPGEAHKRASKYSSYNAMVRDLIKKGEL